MNKLSNRKIAIIVISLSAIVLIIGFLMLKNPLETDRSAEDWNGNQKLDSLKTDYEQIEIVGITDMIFKANKIDQKVNLYNPERNDCLMQMTLYIDGEEYWKSGYIEPNKGYYHIQLAKPLKKGRYKGCLRCDCYKSDSTKLNSANVEFPVYAQ